MRDAMSRAVVGDDVFGDDPTVNALQVQVAHLLGKASALLVPSGTMANQLAIRAHTRHGDEMIAHRRSHIYNYESGAAAALAGVTIRTLDSDDGSLDPDAVASSVHSGDDPHYAPTALLCFEDTHNACGGRVISATNVEHVVSLARAAGLATHLDGARLWNASLASGRPLRELAAPFDTVSVCLSKGLGAPVGSLLVGDEAAIGRAHRFRKMYGGGMRQAGILAAAGRFALDEQLQRMVHDHRRAAELASHLASLAAVRITPKHVETNLVFFEVEPEHPRIVAGDLVDRLRERGIAITGSGHRYRLVTHLDVTDRDVAKVCEALSALLS